MRSTEVARLLSLLGLTLALADVAGAGPAVGAPALTVPFLPQTEALCGGAAAAMVFRYWGDRHADVQQFEPLVDYRAGGIADDVLTDAIRQRNWKTQRLEGSLAVLREHLAAGQPLILLIEDRPQRYHYVVAVGADEDAFYLHDPAWGPSRRLTTAALMQRWGPSNFWTLLVLPRQPFSIEDKTSAASDGTPLESSEPSACDRLVDAAIEEIGRRGRDAADEILGRVRSQCPESSRPVSELAAVRFAARRWSEAADLAAQATRLNASDAYAWDVLGSSRFMLNDLPDALRAWNRVGKPQLDSVRIDGLTHTRYSLVAQALGLVPNRILTAGDFTLAERRLEQLPNRMSARIAFRPESDGFATVDVALVERAPAPRGPIEWAAAATGTLVDREITVAIPGRTGQGEVWTGAWRWWNNRPRVAFGFAAPRIGRLPGVWSVEGLWDVQTYEVEANPAVTREERRRASVSVGDWLAPNLRYAVSVGFDSFNDSRRAASFGATVERRLFADRMSVTGAAATWSSLSDAPGFRVTSIGSSYRSSKEPAGFVLRADAGAEYASAAAPLALWPGAGDGRARPALLRAHPLLDGGILVGPVFGRSVAHATIEGQRWLDRPALVKVGFAVFADVAGAADRARAAGRPVQVDAGGGLRLRLPGRDGVLRVDYGRGLRDGGDALTVGWQMY